MKVRRRAGLAVFLTDRRFDRLFHHSVDSGIGIDPVGKVVENSTDYSLQNTARQALFLPTTREEKYKAKAAIDTFFVRIGDLLSTGLVLLSVQFSLGLQTLSVVNVASRRSGYCS